MRLIARIAVLLLLLPSALRAEQPWRGQPGTVQPVEQIMRHEQSGAARQRVRETRPEMEAEPAFLRKKSAKQPANTASKAIARPIINAPIVTGTSFDAAHYADSNGTPPDSMGDLGPTQFLLCINGRIRTFNRAGIADGALDSSTANFFDAVRGNGDTADPRVRYDKLSGRWFISMLAYETPTRIVLAVSSGPTITSKSTFTFFQFGFSDVGPTPNPDTGSFFDFDTLGVDRSALYVGGNVINPSGPFYVGSTAFVINKANLLAGNLSVTAFRQIGSTAGGGPYTPQGVDNDDPNASEGYFIGRDISSDNHLIIRRVTNPGGAPSLSGNISVTVPLTTQPKGGVLAFGSSFPLADLDDRLFQARLHNGHLVTAHNIEVDANGNAVTGGGRDAIRWYDLTNLSGAPVLSQSGTLFDSSASNPRSYWMGCATMSGQGHVAVAANVASADTYPQVAAALRLNSDAPGTLGAPAIIQAGTANSNDLTDQFNQHRWGDYSTISVDPKDDMTFWTVQEYSNAQNSWAVRVIQLRAPPPATPANAAPAVLAQGQFDTDLAVTGTSQNGSGFFDPGPSFPNHLAAVVNGGGVTANRVTFTDPTHLTVNASVSTNAALGGRSITAINPDGQAMTSGVGTVTIVTANDSDADGIPDWWMLKFFGHATGIAGDKSRAGDDADGDGLTNSQEFKAHTDPRNPTSVLRITALQKAVDGMHITFASVPGKLYRLEWKNAANSATWILLQDNITPTGDSTTVIDSGANGTTARTYRVVAID